jgi:protease-4
VSPGALVLKLDGSIVEQPAEISPFAALGGSAPLKEYRLRDVVRALDAARTDDRVKAVVLDLDRFTGGYPAALIEVGQAIRRVREAKKPVLAYATAYTDSGYLLAANASEVWSDPLGGVMLRGIGGSQLYYKGLVDKLGVNAHVYRVGTYKAAIEPYTRADQSPEAREANEALYGAIFEAWKNELKAARPKAQVDMALTNPVQMLAAQGGDMARASLAGGLVDKLGDRIAFGKHVATIAGDSPKGRTGDFASIRFDNWIAANPVKKPGSPIGVVTIAGEIVDGEAPAGTAGGDTIAKALLKGIQENDIKALVVRVDSPGGSVTASERIRQAILAAKAKKIPVVVSMGSLAASGGYWVSTPGDRIFAEPSTITGSIGVFGLIPTFENSLEKIGVTTDGVRTTPLSGQPDIFAGTNAETDAVLQASVEDIYRDFLGRVAEARKMTPQAVDRIAQGRVWDGGTARQLGLVDQFGGLQDAIRYAATAAKLDPANVHAVYFEKEPGWEAKLAAMLAPAEEDDAETAPSGLFGMIAAEQRGTLARAIGDVRMLMRAQGVQARCLECGGYGPRAVSRAADLSLFDMLIAKLGA